MTQANIKKLRADINRRKLLNHCFALLGMIVIMVAIIVLLGLTIQMAIEGSERITPEFFTSFPSRKPEKAGIYSAWIGTSLVMLVTAMAAVPLGVAAGIYLEEYSKKDWLADIIEINVTNLAGVPSIVYGLLALGLFIYRFHLGQSILTAGLTLALLILPVVIVTTREAIRAIPNSLREAAYALGASKWQAIWDHILPYSFGSILTGIIIGLSRAVGETAPIITVGALAFIAFLPDSPITGEFPFVSFDWMNSAFTVLPIQMFNWVSRPQAAFAINAAAAGTVLVVMTLGMNAIAIWLRYQLRKNLKW